MNLRYLVLRLRTLVFFIFRVRLVVSPQPPIIPEAPEAIPTSHCHNVNSLAQNIDSEVSAQQHSKFLGKGLTL